MATACAPPTAYTSPTPSSAAAASTAGCGSPPCPACGGEASASDSTPATCAGTTFITTLDGYATRPPGTYRPTRRTGTQRSVTVVPAASCTVSSVRRCTSCTALVRRIASSSAARTAGSSAASACSSASAGTRARGSRPRRSARSGVAGPPVAVPRRSIRRSTDWPSGSQWGPTSPADPKGNQRAPGRRSRLSAVAETLPLFPLGMVLFPGVLLPLHVFEERYRELMRALLAGEAENQWFGVVAIRQGWEVGTDAAKALH